MIETLKGEEMDRLIGTSMVNQIIGCSYQKADQLHTFLKSIGISPVGKDGKDNFFWSESSIRSSLDKIILEIDKQKKLANSSPIPNIDRCQAEKVVVRCIGEIEEVRKTLDLIVRQGQTIFQKLNSEIEATTLASTGNEIDTNSIVEELAGFIGSYMADQQRVVTGQIDSGLTGVDTNVERVTKQIGGMTKALGEVKSTLSDVFRQQQNLLTSTYTQNKANREEYMKAMTRIEQSVDQMRESMETRFTRIDYTLKQFVNSTTNK